MLMMLINWAEAYTL